MFKKLLFILIVFCTFSTTSVASLLDISMNTSQLYHTNIEINASPTNFTYAYDGDLSSHIQLAHSSSPSVQTLAFIINKPVSNGDFYGLINITHINGTTIIPVLIHITELIDPDPSLRLSRDDISLNMDTNETCLVVVDVRNNGNIDLHNYRTELLYNCSWITVISDTKTIFQIDREQEIVLFFNTSSTGHSNQQNQLYIITDETIESIFIDLLMEDTMSDYTLLENHSNVIESQLTELNASLASLTTLQKNLLDNITAFTARLSSISQQINNLSYASMEPYLSSGFGSINYSLNSLNKSFESNTNYILENIDILGSSTIDLVSGLNATINEIRSDIFVIETHLDKSTTLVNPPEINENDLTFLGYVLLFMSIGWILNTAGVIDVRKFIKKLKTNSVEQNIKNENDR